MIKVDKSSAFSYSKYIIRKRGRSFKNQLKDLGFVIIPSGYLAYKRSQEMMPVFFESLHGFNEPGKRGAAETKTAQVAYLASELSGAASVIALESRSVCDLNRSEKARKSLSFNLNHHKQKEGAAHYLITMSHLIREYKERIKSGKLNDVFLIVSVHGMRDRKRRDIDIGSGRGKLCRRSIAHWFANELIKNMEHFDFEVRVNVDKGFSGGAHPKKLRNAEFLGKKLNYLQIEFSRSLRRTVPSELAYCLAKVAQAFVHKHWGSRPIKKVNDLVPSMQGRVSGIDLPDDEPLERVYIDRSQRVFLQAKRGSGVDLWLNEKKNIQLEVHQARYSQIGENKILLNKLLLKKLHLHDGDKVKLSKPLICT